MNYTPDPHFSDFIAAQVSSGRYANAEEVIAESLRLLEVREQKRAALREHINRSLDTDVRYSFDEVMDRLKTKLAQEFPE